MKKKLKNHLAFCLFITELSARRECARINAGYSKHMRKHRPAFVTPWNGERDGARGWIVWYHY